MLIKLAWLLAAFHFTLAIAASPALCQAPSQHTPATQTAPRHKQAFEVASVRLEDPQTPQGAFNGPDQQQPFPANRLIIRHTMLRSLICEAFAVQCNYVLGGPDWIDHGHYDLTAKVEGDTLLTREQMNPLLQSLLEDRFHLRAHYEQKIVPGYAMVIAKGGSRLQPTKGAPFLGIMGAYELKFQNDSVEHFAMAIAVPIKQPVVDRTGLKGNYDFDLKFAPETGPLTDDSRFASLPNIFTAMQEQLGLKLVPQQVTINTLIIDRLDRVPTQN